jgi:hypothetical protein
VFSGIFYLFLVVWTVGFGYSFWWGALAAKMASTARMSLVLDQLDNQLTAAGGQLKATADNMDRVEKLSEASAEQEDLSGGSCGIPSGPGRAKLYQARMAVARDVRSQINAIRRGWLSDVQREIGTLGTRKKAFDAAAEELNPEKRTADFSELYESSRRSARDINAESAGNAGYAASALDMTARQLLITPEQRGFTCYDKTLAEGLGFAARNLRKPISIHLDEWHPMEGSSATKEGFLRLWGTVLRAVGIDTKLEGLQNLDWLPLVIAIAVDCGILVLTLSRPRAGGETFLAEGRKDQETQSRLREILRLHSAAAKYIFYDLYFPVGRKHYIAIPDILWREPEGLDPRSLHLAMAALKRRLAAVLLANPSRDVLRLAVQRLRQLHWAAPTDIPEGVVLKFNERLARLLRGSAEPDHPAIYEISEIDRNEAICILSESGERPEYRQEPARNTAAARSAAVEPPSPEPRAPSMPPPAGVTLDFSPGASWLEKAFAAAVSFRRQGRDADAAGMLQIIRAELPSLREKGIDVLGLEGMEGTPFDPDQPFSIISEEPSPLPRNTILRVEGLAFVATEPHKGKRRVIKEGHVVVARSQGNGKTAQEPQPSPILSSATDAPAVNVMDWMPNSGR